MQKMRIESVVLLGRAVCDPVKPLADDPVNLEAVCLEEFPELLRRRTVGARQERAVARPDRFREPEAEFRDPLSATLAAHAPVFVSVYVILHEISPLELLLSNEPRAAFSPVFIPFLSRDRGSCGLAPCQVYVL